jgi:hypothetical protein
VGITVCNDSSYAGAHPGAGRRTELAAGRTVRMSTRTPQACGVPAGESDDLGLGVGRGQAQKRIPDLRNGNARAWVADAWMGRSYGWLQA